MQALAPKPEEGWTCLGRLQGGIAWAKGRTRVLSSLESTSSPDETKLVDTWVISVSQVGGAMAPDSVCRSALRQFGAPDGVMGLEDNHAPGRSRCFFIPLDPALREQCHCQADERVVVEPSGRKWAKKVDA